MVPTQCSGPAPYEGRGEPNHVSNATEHGGRSRDTAHEPRAGGAQPWRTAPRSTMTFQAMVWFALGGLLLCCIGMLFGATWTTQALQPKLRQLADGRRRLNNEWVAVRAARQRLERCPRCGYPLTGAPWFTPPTLTERARDDE